MKFDFTIPKGSDQYRAAAGRNVSGAVNAVVAKGAVGTQKAVGALRALRACLIGGAEGWRNLAGLRGNPNIVQVFLKLPPSPSSPAIGHVSPAVSSRKTPFRYFLISLLPETPSAGCTSFI